MLLKFLASGWTQECIKKCAISALGAITSFTVMEQLTNIKKAREKESAKKATEAQA